MGKTVLVTGAAKGIGAAIASAFATDGAIVALHYRSSREEAEKTLAEVKKNSPDSFLVTGDLTNEDDVRRILGDIEHRAGSVEILINTIGDFIFKPMAEASFEEFRNVIESNVYSTFLCSKAVLPGMRKKKSGYIVNFGSVGCERVLLRPHTTPYYIAKTGVYMMTKLMANEEARHGIRINMISPGALPTSVVKPEHFPAGRGTAFEDIIKAIRFLISPESSYIIGANIEVSGGWSPEL